MSETGPAAQTVTLQTKGGPMQGQLFVPAGTEKRGAMIVLPEAFGVTPGILEDCKKLQAAGYLALGIEIFHRSAPAGFTSAKFDFQEVMPHFKALTNTGVAEDLAAARDFLKLHPRASGKVGAIGFCIGGFCSWLGACETNLTASAVFYGGGIVNERPQISVLKPVVGQKVTCPLLGIFGKDDKSIPQAERDAMEAALTKSGVEHEIVVYENAGHAFCNFERQSYAPGPTAEAWKKTLEFLSRHLA